MITYTDIGSIVDELTELFNFEEDSYPYPTIFITDPDMIRDIFLKHIKSDDTSEYWDEEYYLDLNILSSEHEFLVSLRNTSTEERTVRIRVDYYNAEVIELID